MSYYKYHIVLVLIIMLSLVTHLVWLKLDTRPPAYDEAAYLERSSQIHSTLRIGTTEFIKSIFGLGEYKGSFHPHRSLLLLTTVPFYFMFGESADVGVMANLVYVIILLASIYGIGKRMFNEKVGVLSAFIISTFPLICFLSRIYLPEIASSAICALSVYLLIRSNYFSNRKFTILFGITLGLGMLTIENVFIGVLGPLVYIASKSSLLKERGRAFNFAISILIGLGITSLWYLPSFSLVKFNVFNLSFSREVASFYGFPTTYSLDFFTYYPITAVHYGISSIYAMIFCVGLFPYYRQSKLNEKLGTGKMNYSSKDRNWILTLWIIVSYLILTFCWNKDLIYFTVAFPPIALIIAAGILSIGNQKIRKCFICLTILLGLLQFFAYSYDIGWLSNKLRGHVYPDDNNMPLSFYGLPRDSQPSREDWKIEEILTFINKDKSSAFPDKGKCRIRIVPDCPRFSWIVFSYYITLNELPLSVRRGDSQFIKSIDYENILEGCHYVVTKTGEQGEGDWDRDFMMGYSQKVLEQLEESSSYKKLDKQFLMPDGSLAQIYRQTS